VTIERTFDAAHVNRICNHPEVRPWLGGEGEIDLSAVIADEQNYALFGPEGGFILHAGPGASFEVHSQFTPEGRQSSFRAMLAGMDYMFTRTQCLQLTTFLPDDNPAAKGLALKGGFRPWFRRGNHICGPGMQARIDVDDWVARTPDLEADGEDEIHARYVGALRRMCERGQEAKGIALFNRYAANAGREGVTIVEKETTGCQ